MAQQQAERARYMVLKASVLQAARLAMPAECSCQAQEEKKRTIIHAEGEKEPLTKNSHLSPSAMGRGVWFSGC